MTDDLRTRIAAVLCAHPDKWDGTCCGDSKLEIEVQNDWASHVADVLIRKLGLQRDDEYELGSYTPSGRYRYVTEWTAQ